MNSSILTKPSFYSLALTGFLSFLIVVIVFKNFSNFKRLPFDRLIKTIAVIGILIGVHGLLHLGFEKIYAFNPME